MPIYQRNLHFFTISEFRISNADQKSAFLKFLSRRIHTECERTVKNCEAINNPRHAGAMIVKQDTSEGSMINII